MRVRRRHNCPGCGGVRWTPPFILTRQPVVLNYRFRDASAARRVLRRNIGLAQCRSCGLVFNSTFDPKAIPYDENYENRQCFSPSFEAHLFELAQALTKRHRLGGGRVLEVGCGKGDFLRLLCRVAGAAGDGYDTSYQPGLKAEPSGLSFYRQYVEPGDISTPYNAVVCRHVVEHVPEIGVFLEKLCAIARAAGDPIVAVETPRFEWIVEQLSLWDIFYEHCNYFPESSLAYLCRRAGFKVIRQRPVFGGQYQLLELRTARTSRPPTPPGIPVDARLTAFGRRARAKLERLRRRIERLSEGGPWGVWGAGAKGVALVNQLGGRMPTVVIDSNPAKQGGVLSGGRAPIVAPGDPRVRELSLVLIVNPNYAPEIRQSLARISFPGKTISL